MRYRRPHRGFTPAAIEDIRHRYVETDEPQSSIALDYNVDRKTIERVAQTQGWVMRRDRTPRDLPRDRRMQQEAERAVRREAEAAVDALSASAAQDAPEGGARPATAEDAPAASIADRLERAVEKELRTVELMRATLGPEPQGAAEAERTARILERLADTLTKVRRLRFPELPAAATDAFDIPKDIDAFRLALARRIEAFVRSRTDIAVPDGGEPSGDAQAR